MKLKILSMNSYSDLSRQASLEFEKQIEKELEGKEFDSFTICLHFPREIEEGEKELAKSEFNSLVGTELIQKFGTKRDFTEPELEIRIDFFRMKFELWFRPIYLYARYKKFSRNLPQTKWDCTFCRGKGCEKCGFTGKKYLDSIQELVGEEAKKDFRAEGYRFHGCGREDIDARMLGSGRPFCIELINPESRKSNLAELEGKINSNAREKIEVIGLRFSDKNEARKIKSEEFEKTYEARIEFESGVSREKIEDACAKAQGAELLQNTPNRVLHRRSDLERKRKIIYAKVKEFSEDGKSALIEIRAESGTYIKEFVSGDEGRTKPSLSELIGVRAKVKELDVIGIHD